MTTKHGEPVPRRHSMRLRGYDYSHPGVYFVTICTARRVLVLGEIGDGKMRLNDAGRIVQRAWNESPAHSAGLETDAFVVMPNHVHGVLILHGVEESATLVGAGSSRPFSVIGSSGGEAGAVTAPLQTPGHKITPRDAVTAPLRVTLGRIVAYFKYESARRINAARSMPAAPVWQRGYYDHVVRRGESLDRIRRYVAENPACWAFDRENPRAVHVEPEDAWARP